VLEPRLKSDSKGKGKETEKASKPPSECMSTSSDDDYKRSLRAKGLSDKSSDRGKSKSKNKSKRKKDKASSEDLPNEKQDKKKRKPKAEPSAKPAKESVNSDREKGKSRPFYPFCIAQGHVCSACGPKGTPSRKGSNSQRP
jgi:hypothetical protein